MLIPFAYSAVKESVFQMGRKDGDDKASKAGIRSMIVGFIVVVVVFAFLMMFTFAVNDLFTIPPSDLSTEISQL